MEEFLKIFKKTNLVIREAQSASEADRKTICTCQIKISFSSTLLKKKIYKPKKSTTKVLPGVVKNGTGGPSGIGLQEGYSLRST